MKENKNTSIGSLHQHQHFRIDLSAFYQKKKIRTYTALVMTIATICFFLFFAIRPTVFTISNLLREIKDNKKVVAGLDQKIEALNSAQIEFQRARKELYLIDEALPLQPDLGLLVRQIEALARRDQIELGPVRYDQSTLLKGAKTPEGKAAKVAAKETGQKAGLGFSLVVNGDYDKLHLFIKDLTSLRRIIRLESVGFRQQKSGSLSLTLEAQAIYLDQ